MNIKYSLAQFILIFAISTPLLADDQSSAASSFFNSIKEKFYNTPLVAGYHSTPEEKQRAKKEIISLTQQKDVLKSQLATTNQPDIMRKIDAIHQQINEQKIITGEKYTTARKIFFGSLAAASTGILIALGIKNYPLSKKPEPSVPSTPTNVIDPQAKATILNEINSIPESIDLNLKTFSFEKDTYDYLNKLVNISTQLLTLPLDNEINQRIKEIQTKLKEALKKHPYLRGIGAILYIQNAIPLERIKQNIENHEQNPKTTTTDFITYLSRKANEANQTFNSLPIFKNFIILFASLYSLLPYYKTDNTAKQNIDTIFNTLNTKHNKQPLHFVFSSDIVIKACSDFEEALEKIKN